MKFMKLRTFIVLVLAGITGSSLLYTSQSVQDKQQELVALQQSLAQEKEALQLLNTEWAFLNNPQRLEMLSKKYLDLVPPQPNTIVSTPEEIPSRSVIAEEEISITSSDTAVHAGEPVMTPAVLQVPVPPRRPGSNANRALLPPVESGQ